jgi:hypothetical protein
VILPRSEPARADREAWEREGRPLVQDETHGLCCLGPAPRAHTLTSARLPDLALVDLDGQPFALPSLAGSKVLLLAWASW